MSNSPANRIFEHLSSSEQDMLLELLLASGSLKELATEYGVSYPTIRARLDRVIKRVLELRGENQPDPMANKLADLVEAGQLTPAGGRDLLALHRQILEQTQAQ